MLKLLESRSTNIDPMINIFGIIAFLNFLAVFLYKDFSSSQPFFYHIRFWGGFFCLGLLILKNVPNNIKTLKYLYWYFTITFCLPFYGMYIFLDNHHSIIWQSKVIIGLIWLVFITNWIEFSLTLLIGIILGAIFYKYLHPDFEFNQVTPNGGLLYNYILAVFIAMIFAHRKDEITSVLIKSQQKLQQALEVKDRFLRNMSHEIRIPLHGILNLSTIVNEQWDDLPEHQRKSLVEQLANNSGRLMNLVSNLLDISTIIKGKLKLFKDEYDLTKITKEVINEFSSILKSKATIISFKSVEQMMCLCDKERISQVIRNLISNALKYGNNSNIKIEIHKHNQYVRFSIIDHGVGIPENELEDIFKQFEESSRTKTSAGGTGLGLAICKEIIKAHDGEIFAQNNLTKGATFTFDLPSINKKQISKISQNNNSKKKTVLVIDDEEIVLTSASFILEALGYTPLCSQGGAVALELLKEKVPDLILLDLMMPGMNGDEFLNIIRNSEKLKNIPVIIQTGFPNAEELQNMKKLGISGLLKKPYDKQDITQILSKTI